MGTHYIRQWFEHRAVSAPSTASEDARANERAAVPTRFSGGVAIDVGQRHARGAVTAQQGASPRTEWRELWPNYETAVHEGTWGDGGRDY